MREAAPKVRLSLHLAEGSCGTFFEHAIGELGSQKENIAIIFAKGITL